MLVSLMKAEKRYGTGFVVGPVSLQLDQGITCLIGANGAGKSTLLRLISGTDKPSSGSVSVRIMESYEPTAKNREVIGYMPQEFTLPSRVNAWDFLYHVAWLKRVKKQDRAAAVDQALSEVGLSDRKKSPIGELSGGMRRRVGLAQAIIHDPGLLVLDEPTAGLDPVQRVAIRDLVSELAASRVVLYSTHLVEDVSGVDADVIALRDGHVTFHGSREELLSTSTDEDASKTLERAFLRVLGV